MNYHRIYREFIRDRLSKPVPEGYTETHHNEPRILGGDNSAQNLVELTPEDHFFAHLLLARMHPEIPGLVAAPGFMIGLDTKLGRPTGYSRASRGTYGIARRMHAEAVSGENNWNFDPTIHHLRHPEHGDRFLTGHAFRREIGIENVGQFSKLMMGQIYSISGWYMPSINPDGVVGYARSSLSLIATKRDRMAYYWKHRDGRTFRGTKNEFMEYAGVTRQEATLIAHRYVHSCRDWYNPDHNPEGLIGDERNSGERHARYDGKLYRFSHDDGRIFEGTRHEMTARHGPFGRRLCGVVNGSKLSVNGWMLDAVRAEKAHQRFLGQGVVHVFRHPEQGEFVGTQRDFIQMTGVSPGNICSVIAGRQKTSKGWSYVGKAAADRVYTRRAAPQPV